MDESIFITAAESGERIDALLARAVEGLSRSAAQHLIADGLVLRCGEPVRKNYKCTAGDCFEVVLPRPADVPLVPQDIPLDVVYEDADVIVVNKTRGMVVHPAPGHPDGTLVNALLYRCGDSLSGIGGERRPGIVHRIDKDTSGLLVVAKNDAAHVSLSEQIKNKTCRRIYLALVEGVVKENDGVIDTFIGRSVKNRTMMAVKSDGRRAVTHYKVIRRYKDYTLMEFSLETGRTHQIRVHTKYLGHPVVGDPVYGYKTQKFRLNGQLLHAFRLELTHPKSGERMVFEAPLPDYFRAVLAKLDSSQKQ